ncbi:MAG: hypothetical protein ACI9J2_002653 [Saprospiraceae bacterium]|jgi:hypothetical protein
MSDYPSLKQMGVTNPSQITRYSLQNINNVDILRIVYKRAKGSLLPVSRKYKFGRAEKMVVTDRGQNKTEMVHEISPFLNKVISELSQVVKSKHSRSDSKEVIMDELMHLEEEMNTRIAYLKNLIQDLD